MAAGDGGTGTSAVGVLVRLRIEEGRESEFIAELAALLPRIRGEEACISISAHQDGEDPTRFLLFELWSSLEEFEEFYETREYLGAYIERVQRLWSEPRDLTLWPQVA